MASVYSFFLLWSALVNAAVEVFDRWLRNQFRDLNTQLEEAYFLNRYEILHDRPDLEKLKQTLLTDGAELIDGVASDEIPCEPGQRYELLGMVGYYLAACRRHEIDRCAITGKVGLAPAWGLASRLGSSLGVAPRYVFAHQSLYNRTVRDVQRTFTSLKDEYLFINSNGLAVLAYRRAANALRPISAMGVSNPMAGYLLEDARTALSDVLRFNQILGRTLDVERFFFNIRPYFKPHRIGSLEYRGANAGDFAAVNEIDLLLGLCSTKDLLYQTLLAEKYAYVPPDDQRRLRAVIDGKSLLEQFLQEGAVHGITPQLRQNAELFLDVCRSHGAAYAYHHERLVKPFLEEPAKAAPPDRLGNITASGPPLEVVIGMLERLRDLRTARDVPGLVSARRSLDKLRQLLAA